MEILFHGSTFMITDNPYQKFTLIDQAKFCPIFKEHSNLKTLRLAVNGEQFSVFSDIELVDTILSNNEQFLFENSKYQIVQSINDTKIIKV